MFPSSHKLLFIISPKFAVQALTFSVLFGLVSSCGNYYAEKPQAADFDRDQAGPVTFERVRSRLFVPKCLRCHAGNSPEADLDLSVYEGILASGVVERGDPQNSALYQRVADDEMPPSGPPASGAQKSLLRKWIEEGALQ